MTLLSAGANLDSQVLNKSTMSRLVCLCLGLCSAKSRAWRHHDWIASENVNVEKLGKGFEVPHDTYRQVPTSRLLDSGTPNAGACTRYGKVAGTRSRLSKLPLHFSCSFPDRACSASVANWNWLETARLLLPEISNSDISVPVNHPTSSISGPPSLCPLYIFQLYSVPCSFSTTIDKI